MCPFLVIQICGKEWWKMKGFINEDRIDVPPCGTCKHKNKMVDEAPCDKCIDKTDLALRKPANETEFSNYERSDEK